MCLSLWEVAVTFVSCSSFSDSSSFSWCSISQLGGPGQFSLDLRTAACMLSTHLGSSSGSSHCRHSDALLTFPGLAAFTLYIRLVWELHG